MGSGDFIIDGGRGEGGREFYFCLEFYFKVVFKVFIVVKGNFFFFFWLRVVILRIGLW